MGVDLHFNGRFSVFGGDMSSKNRRRMIKKIKKLLEEKTCWKVEFLDGTDEVMYIGFDSSWRIDVKDAMEKLIPFLKVINSYEYAMVGECLVYEESWGDYEKGAVYACSYEKKIIISRLSCTGISDVERSLGK